MKTDSIEYDLSKICKEVTITYPFYGLLLLNVNRRFAPCKTARAVLKGINYSLEFDPDFWNSLTREYKQGLLLHEIMHLAYFHLTEFDHLKNKELANIAMDLEINQKIPVNLLPPGGVTLDKFSDYGLLPNEGTNVYYKKLMDLCKKDPDMADSLSGEPGSPTELPNGETFNLPVHDWDSVREAPASVKQIVTKQMVNIVDNAVKEVRKQNGTIPHDIEQLLEKLKELKPAKFNWKAYLRRFTGYSQKTFIAKTKRKHSKRFIHDDGLRVGTLSRIFWVIDSSASVSDAELREIQNEMYHAYRSGHEIIVTFADTTMQKPFKFKPHQDIKIEKRGGTDFNEPVDYYIKHKSKFTAMIYLTDGEAPAPKNKPKNILWVLTSISKPCDHLPGKIIKLN